MYHSLGYCDSCMYGPHGNVHFIVSGHLSCFHVLAFNMGLCREHECQVEICPLFLPPCTWNGFVGSCSNSFAHLLRHHWSRLPLCHLTFYPPDDALQGRASSHCQEVPMSIEPAHAAVPWVRMCEAQSGGGCGLMLRVELPIAHSMSCLLVAWHMGTPKEPFFVTVVTLLRTYGREP